MVSKITGKMQIKTTMQYPRLSKRTIINVGKVADRSELVHC